MVIDNNNLSSRDITRINRGRNIVRLLQRLFNQCDNNNDLDCFSIANHDRQNRFADAILNCDGFSNSDDIRVWLSQDQMDSDSDTWRGINRVFDVSRRDMGVLRRAGIVTDDFFDDGTLHIDINRQAAADAVRNAAHDDNIDSIVRVQNRAIDNANRIINGLDID